MRAALAVRGAACKRNVPVLPVPEHLHLLERLRPTGVSESPPRPRINSGRRHGADCIGGLLAPLGVRGGVLPDPFSRAICRGLS